MSTIKTDSIVPSDGTTLNIGTSGDTITVPTGASLVVTDGIPASSLPTTTVAKGGTNLTSFTAGDLLYATGSTTLVKLAKGSAGQTLQINGGGSAPSWVTVSAATVDLNPITKSIATLALRDSVLHNLNAYALSNSFIDTFQDSSGIGSLSSTARQAGEFVKCTGSFGSAVTYKPLAGGAVSGNGQSLTISNSDTRVQTSASGSGWYYLNKDNTYQNGGRHTVIYTLVQVGGGGGPGFLPGINKNDISNSSYVGNNFSAKTGQGFYKSGAAGGAVGDKIRMVYDPAGDENTVVFHRYFNADSGYVAVNTTYGSAFQSTVLNNTGLYHMGMAYKDSGDDYIVDFEATYEPFTPSATGSLISIATTAPSTVSSASLVLSYFNTAGTATLNTDLKGYVSADNGSNWTAVVLTAGPLFSTGVLTAVSDKVSISNTGTAMKYKVEWANQGASKETRLDGVSLNY